MPERRIGHVKYRQQQIKKNDLDVSYVLATNTGKKHWGKIRDIHDTTQMDDQEGHVVRIRVDLNDKDQTQARPGASTNAKVYCGYVPIGYTFLHEAIEYLQNAWFKYL